MEYVEGRDVDAVIRRRPDRTRALIAIAEGLLAGLGDPRAGHHSCDIKPSNMRLMGGDVVKLMDFGIARSTTSRSRAHEVVPGAAVHGAGARRERRWRADLYAVGVTLFTLL